MITLTDNKSFTVESEPKVIFTNEMWVGMVCVPIKTELDFSGVHPSQHEFVLDLAMKMYYKNTRINKPRR